MLKKAYFIFSMSFMIVGTCIGVGILGLPLQTGKAGFIISIIGLSLCWFLMASTGWIMIYRLINGNSVITDMAQVYDRDLGGWAKHLNSLGYILTFYGLIVAHLCGAAMIVITIVPGLRDVPNIMQIITVVYFVLTTYVVLCGMKTVSKFNVFFALMLFFLFFMMVFKVIPHVSSEHLTHFNLKELPLELPILVTALGFQPVLPSICTHCKEKGVGKKGLISIYAIGTGFIFFVNFIWLFAVIGTLPLTSPDHVSLIDAFNQGLPATVPLAKVIGSNIITFLSMFFSFFVITTSYFGLGIGFLNYMKDLSSKYVKRNIFTDFMITFFIPLLVALIYPNAFLKMLDFVGGFGVVIIFGFLPGFLALKKCNAPYIKRLGVFAIIVSAVIFSVEFYLTFIK